MHGPTKNIRTRATIHFTLSRIGRAGSENAHARIAGVALVLLLLPTVASASLPGVTDNSWKGTTDALWSTTTNWNLGHSPTSTEAARFDQLSTSHLTITNDLTGVSISGFANTSLAANTGPAGPILIQGNAITIGATGIINGSGTPADPFGYTGPAQANITVDVDLTLSASQDWKAGGPGTATTAQPGGQQSVIVGATPNGHTVTMNGNTVSLKTFSNGLDMVIVNSKLVDGSAA